MNALFYNILYRIMKSPYLSSEILYCFSDERSVIRSYRPKIQKKNN